jgi:hypothetical protein
MGNNLSTAGSTPSSASTATGANTSRSINTITSGDFLGELGGEVHYERRSVCPLVFLFSPLCHFSSGRESCGLISSVIMVLDFD